MRSNTGTCLTRRWVGPTDGLGVVAKEKADFVTGSCNQTENLRLHRSKRRCTYRQVKIKLNTSLISAVDEVSHTHFIRRLAGSKAAGGRCGEDKNLCL